MEDKAAILAHVCSLLADGQVTNASAALKADYPFVPLANAGRKYSVTEMMRLYLRDGFTDRYSGTRLVSIPALRLISRRLPDLFPFHRNWRSEACHFAFWELAPTLDHIVPVSRGGADNESNWATTSMVRNSAKANFTLDELGWTLMPCGSHLEWDGLLRWFMAECDRDSALVADSSLRRWYAAARKLLPPTL